MPNGGLDNCGTCWFNSAHKGEVGHFDIPAEAEVRCTIRDLIIKNPYWTYCANHPCHASDLVDLPIGPVFVNAGGYPYRREISVESPDTEIIRNLLLRFLDNMPRRRRAKATESRFDEAVIDQLGRFREVRAVPGLKRVLAFDPFDPPEPDFCGANRAPTIACALETLAAITGDEALADLVQGLKSGLEKAAHLEPYEWFKDALVLIRYHAVRGLRHCSRAAAQEPLAQALRDPNQDIVAIAKELLQKNRVSDTQQP